MKIKTEAIIQLGIEMMLAEIQGTGSFAKLEEGWNGYAHAAESILLQIEEWAKERDKDNE